MINQPDRLYTGASIAVLVPCHNEERTIGPLVADINSQSPHARVIVIDNDCSDGTAAKARLAGAEVMQVSRRGKGNAVRWAFDHIDADIYVMMDGDGTYDPAEAPLLIERLILNGLDMVVGARRNIGVDAGRLGHSIGNRLFNVLFSNLLGAKFTDIFSGYRAFSRRYVKSFPALSSGFELEAEMSAHAQLLRLEVAEIPVSYGRRPVGSKSKLSTCRDGLRILHAILMLTKSAKPFSFFGCLALVTLTLSVATGLPVVIDFLETGRVDRQPTWVMSLSLTVISVTMFFSGVILHSIARGQLEQKFLVLRSVQSSESPNVLRPGPKPLVVDLLRQQGEPVQLVS